MPLSPDQVRRLAGPELNALRFTDAVPEVLERGRIASAGSPIFDVNGTLLFHRVPIVHGRERIGYADIAACEILGDPLLAVASGIDWKESRGGEVKRANTRSFQRRPDAWEAPVVRRIDPAVITKTAFPLPQIVLKSVDTKTVAGYTINYELTCFFSTECLPPAAGWDPGFGAGRCGPGR